MGQLRDDLALAAYAVRLGFSIRGTDADSSAICELPSFDSAGIPHDKLSFALIHPAGDDIIVWATARGWRVAQKRGEHYQLPQNKDFHQNLLSALDSAYAIRKENDLDWRPATRVFTLPTKAELYRMSPDDLLDILNFVDAVQHEVSDARREAIHRLGGKSEHKRPAPGREE